VKIDIRLVPNMDIDDILLKLRKHLNRHGFPEIEIKVGYGWNPSKTSINSDIAQAAIRASEKHNVETLPIPIYRGSIPIVMFSELPLALPSISAGLGRMGHSHEANEFITLEGLRVFEKYVVTLLYEYANMPNQAKKV